LDKITNHFFQMISRENIKELEKLKKDYILLITARNKLGECLYYHNEMMLRKNKVYTKIGERCKITFTRWKKHKSKASMTAFSKCMKSYGNNAYYREMKRKYLSKTFFGVGLGMEIERNNQYPYLVVLCGGRQNCKKIKSNLPKNLEGFPIRYHYKTEKTRDDISGKGFHIRYKNKKSLMVLGGIVNQWKKSKYWGITIGHGQKTAKQRVIVNLHGTYVGRIKRNFLFGNPNITPLRDLSLIKFGTAFKYSRQFSKIQKSSGKIKLFKNYPGLDVIGKRVSLYNESGKIKYVGIKLLRSPSSTNTMKTRSGYILVEPNRRGKANNTLHKEGDSGAFCYIGGGQNKKLIGLASIIYGKNSLLSIVSQKDITNEGKSK
jgi:hypothetical protein